MSLSLAIDKLWQEHTRHMDDMKKKTTDTIHVWGQKKAQKHETKIEYKDTVFAQEKLSADVKNSSPYTRLKIVMDYWCSLWFWPIDEADKLPTRSEFLEDISKLVEKRADIIMELDANKSLFSDTMDEDIRQIQLDELGFIDVNELIAKSDRLQVVQEVSAKQKFLHWELEFADVFAKKGGFDLILGNPPWIKVVWNESGIMGESNPLFDIRQFSASKLNELRSNTFENYPSLLKEYTKEYTNASSTQNFLGSNTNYPLLEGKANLYKCFLPKAWGISNSKGISGFIHPEGVYDDPKGGLLRTEIYRRLRYHFQYKNELSLFQEVSHTRKYSVNIFKNKNSNIDFLHISNLFSPQTIDACFEHDSDEEVGGIKNNVNKWNTNGHKSRVVSIGKKNLELFAKLYDKEGTSYLQARLPSIHVEEFMSVIQKFVNYSKRLGDIKSTYYSTDMWNETTDQSNGIIERNTTFPDSSKELILSGPHFMVGNPLYKTPRKLCPQSSYYDVLDLTIIDDEYLPRTNYTPSVSDYDNRIPIVNFKGDRKKITNFYRYFHRRRIDSSVERTLIPIISSKGISHINAVISFVFEDTNNLISLQTAMQSIVFDFIVKSSGKEDLMAEIISIFPLIETTDNMKSRTLLLTCLTTHYKELYEEQYNKKFTSDSWTKKDDPRLNHNFFTNLTPNWQRDVALRTDYERRQALVEIDVLVAQELKLTLEELKTIYRIQFPVLKQNENETFYDINGRIVFTVSKGLTGVGLPRKADKTATPYKIVIDGEIVEEKPLGWEDIINMRTGEIHRTIIDDTMPNGPIERTIIYVAPFAKCDREKDYEVAWAEFERRGNV